MINNDLIKNIILKIKELESEYQNNQGLILSESDLKCQLYKKIYPLLSHNITTMDSHIKGSSLHTEIKFFDEKYSLSLVPDITILNPEYLSILHSVRYIITSSGIKYKKASSKEFEFGGDTIIIELKFCKNKTGITNSKILSYKRDIQKIIQIQNIINNRSDGKNRVLGIFVIFNKTDKKVSQFNDFWGNFSNIDDLELIYGSGKVNFENQDNISESSYEA